MNIKNIEILEFGEELVLRGQCILTGESFYVKVRKVDYEEWINGKLAQYVFPYLSSGEREFLISSVSPKGWRKFLEESY